MSPLRILTQQGGDKICILRAGRPQQPIMGDITLFEFRNEVVRATCKCSLCLPLGPAGRLFRVETPNAKFTFALRMFEPLQRMSGKAQWLAGARGLPEARLRNSLESGKRWEGNIPSSYF